MLSLEELRAVRTKRRLTKEEKGAYCQYWRCSHQSQRMFCEQEGLSLATFSSWLKSLSCKVDKKENKSSFIAVEVSSPSANKTLNMALQFKLPNGLVIEGQFSLSEVSCFIKELSNGLTSLC